MPAWKRAVDVALCIAAMPALALCTLAMTIAMQFGSPGPVFFQQERVGFGGRRFKCYKFRTMTVGADTTTHQAYFCHLIGSSTPMAKLDSRGDSRLVPGGWLLRASGLDELPQLINVLKGEMSLVGPRPCLPYEYEQYLPWHRKRFNATPGLTGLWQVSGKNRTTFEEMINLDIEYSETKTLWLDVKIIFLTVPALVFQIGDIRRIRSRTAMQSMEIVPARSAKPTDLTDRPT
jgi:lipopolysaccharide/colanic/teichoic acid biosynthesis glycosyltransferase